MIMQDRKYIGVFPRDISSFIFSNYLFTEKQLLYLVVKNSGEEKWARKFLDRKKIVAYSINRKKYLTNLSLEDILANSNLMEIMPKNRIDKLFTTSKYTFKVKKWGEENKVLIISPPYWKYKKFEDKIWFDNFLAIHGFPKPDSAIYCPLKKPLPISGLSVLQHPDSWGGEKTYYIRRTNELDTLLKTGEIRRNRKYLVRKFIQGIPYGITVFLIPGMIALSALRVQCFHKKQFLKKKLFWGIQWLPSKNFSGIIQDQINEVFYKLCLILYQKHYYGYFNFDFIIDQAGKIFLLECNPRFSAATTHLIKFPQLISEIDTGRIFFPSKLTKGLFKDKDEIKFYPLPSTYFDGSLLEIVVFPKTRSSKVKITQEYSNGLYENKKGKYYFKDPDIRKLSSSGKQFIFFSESELGEVYGKPTTIALITSNYSLFDLNGSLNQQGKQILARFRY